METNNVYIGWNGKNHEAILELGADTIIATGATLDDVKKAFIEVLEFHLEDEPYSVNTVWVLRPSALLRNTSSMVKVKAIAELSGLNERRLGHYLQGRREGNDDTRIKIVNALHKLADGLKTVV